MTSSQRWMQSIEPWRSFSGVLMYFDLVNHSKWHEGVREDRWAEPYEARECLANNLRSRLEQLPVYQHHWAGDGGLFVTTYENPRFADRACQAMVMMHEVFHDWRGRVSNRSTLECRITGTYCSDICAGPKPEFWSSSDLNDFLKYERDLGRSGAICITHELFAMLGAARTHFEDGEWIKMGSRDIQRHVDRRHPGAPMSWSPPVRESWIHGLDDLPGSTYQVDSLPAGARQIGDSVILSTARTSAGYELIELHHCGTDAPEGFLNVILERDRSKWDDNRRELENRYVSGSKLRVRRIGQPLLDDDVFRVEYSLCDYSEVRAFREVLEDTSKLKDYWPNALSVVESDTTLPNTLSNHVLVTFGRPPARRLVMCRRGPRMEHARGYYEGRWSVSLEEQYKPETDSSIQESVKRGVEEELGDDIGTVTVSIHAFQMETLLLYFGFLAHVDLPDVDSFEQLEKSWLGALDRAEHAAIVALRIEPDVLKACLQSEEFPQWIREDRSLLEVSSGFKPPQFGDAKDNLWHPTSPVRLALALSLAKHGII